MKELYARYPGCMDEGAVHAVCKMAELSVLKWLYDCEPFLLFKKFDGESRIFIAASEKGREDVVHWLVELFPDHVRSLEYAAEGGHLNLIKWLTTHVRWDEDSLRRTFKNAVAGCHLETAKFLHEFAPLCIQIAAPVEVASKGDLPMMTWLEEIGCTGGYPFVQAAASNGRLEILERLHSSGELHCSTDAMDSAAANGHLDVVKFLHVSSKAGCTTRAMSRAAAKGHLDVVKWLHEHRTEGCMAAAMRYAARNGHLDILEWIGPDDDGGAYAAMYNAVDANRLDIARALREKV